MSTDPSTDPSPDDLPAGLDEPAAGLWRQATAALQFPAVAPAALRVRAELLLEARVGLLTTALAVTLESRDVLAASLDAVSAERDRLRAALEMLAQVRHVSGSAQGAFRSNLRLADAALAGADLRSVEVVEAVAAGTWKPA